MSSGSSGSGMAMSNNVNIMNNNDENENLLLEPASVINERSNSHFVNGTESDELTLPLSVTQSPKLLSNSTGTN